VTEIKLIIKFTYLHTSKEYILGALNFGIRPNLGTVGIGERPSLQISPAPVIYLTPIMSSGVQCGYQDARGPGVEMARNNALATTRRPWIVVRSMPLTTTGPILTHLAPHRLANPFVEPTYRTTLVVGLYANHVVVVG